MKIRLARKVAYTRTQRPGTVLAALRRLPYGERVANSRWWWWARVRARYARLRPWGKNP